MIERLEKIVTLLERIPVDLCAVVIILIGAGLAALGHHDEANLTIGGGLGIFKGRSSPPESPSS